MEKASLACFSLAVQGISFTEFFLIVIRHFVDSQNANNLRICQKRCELCSNSYREKNWLQSWTKSVKNFALSYTQETHPAYLAPW